jgi:ATP-dependent helicase HrpB
MRARCSVLSIIVALIQFGDVAPFVPSSALFAISHSFAHSGNRLLSRRQAEIHEDNDENGSGLLLEKLALLFDQTKTTTTNGKDNGLPIDDILHEICTSLESKPNLLLEAPPGAGKTTKVPLALLWDRLQKQQQQQHGNKENDSPQQQPLQQVQRPIQLIVVEPRRVAARSAALRMAKLLDEAVGETVGYVIRGESQISSSKTRITVMTDGVLLQKMRYDPELQGVDVVLMDEFHERGIGSDTALALVRESQKLFRGDSLQMVVMSATLLGGTIPQQQQQQQQESNNGEGAPTSSRQDDDYDDDKSAGQKLIHALGGPTQCRVLQSDGRQYPIEILWANQLSWTGTSRCPPLGALLRDRKSLVEIMSMAIEQAVVRAPARGDVLAFLPGVPEIRRTINLLKERGNLGHDVEILPLYGALPKDQQDKALFPGPNAPRRVIVSSPIAEASLTLERVTCVVDSGLRREPRCDVDTGMPRLITTRCSKASATQRAGRAGRVQQGLCLRIYNQAEWDINFLEHAPPEIKSADLSDTVLLLADWGCSSVTEIVDGISFVDPPDNVPIEKAIRLLVDLKGLEDSKGGKLSITAQGQSIAKIPTHPRFATNIVRAMDNPVQLAGAVTAAFLMDDEVGSSNFNTPDLAFRLRELFQGKSQASTTALLNYAARIGNSAKRAVQTVIDGKIEIGLVSNALGQALVPGFVDLVAERKGDASYGGSAYMLSLGRSARLDDVKDAPDYLVVVETSTSDDGKARVRAFAGIDKESLLQMAMERDVIFTVPSRGHEVRAKRVMAVGSLELSSRPLPVPSSEQVCEALKQTIEDLGGVFSAIIQTLSSAQRERLDELCSRVNLARRQSGDMGSSWPSCFEALDEEAKGSATANHRIVLEELIEPWLQAALSLKSLDPYAILWGSLTQDQQRQLDAEYPVNIEAPDGSTIPVNYAAEIPSASAKLQQFFGTVESPAVGPKQNRLPLSLSLLSPSGKVLAQTVDLPFFWRETYPSVRSEMRGRYAKHPWPEDPMNAIATRQTKKQQAASNENATLKGADPGYDAAKKKKRGKK